MAPYKGLKIVTYHRSWPNFAEAFGLDVIGYVEPKPGIPPSPSHTLDLMQEMKAQNVKIIIIEPYFDPKTPNAIGRDTGAQVLVLAPSVGGAKEVTDYFKLFDYDVNTAGRGDQADRGEVAPMDADHPVSSCAAPFVASLIIAGIHAYLGVHVVERGVIFVDLSLAQIAALGATIALLMPLVGRRSARAVGLLGQPAVHVHRRRDLLDDPQPPGAASRRRRSSASRYAVASAAAILAMSKSTSEGRAPEGHARRQHPRGVVARGLEDGAALRRRSACSTTSSASSSWRSR